MNKKKIIILIIFLFCVVFAFISSVSAAKFENYHVNYHKHTYNYAADCSAVSGGKCPVAWKTTILVGVSGSSSNLKKYSHGRVKLSGKAISKKWKYSTMTEFGKDYFIINAKKSGTKSVNGKTLKFEGYDKKKRKWVSLGSKKIKTSNYSRRHGYY